jgi:hypothetical protein
MAHAQDEVRNELYAQNKADLDHKPGWSGDHPVHVKARKDEAKRLIPDWYGDITAEKAGEKYEIDKVAEQYGKTAEEVKEYLQKNHDAFLRFGYQILQNKEAFGEPLTASQQAFKATYEYLTIRRRRHG